MEIPVQNRKGRHALKKKKKKKSLILLYMKNPTFIIKT